jgi:hypothetical protein
MHVDQCFALAAFSGGNAAAASRAAGFVASLALSSIKHQSTVVKNSYKIATITSVLKPFAPRATPID